MCEARQMWKVICFDDEGEDLGYTYWATLKEAQQSKQWLEEMYGFEVKIEQVEEEA